jgi:TolB protein
VTGGTLTGQLSGAGGTSLLAKTYSGDGRKAAHQFADDITKALGKCDGFATSRLAAISGGAGHKELYVFDIDGANQVQVTHDNVISARPKWSTDGTKLAYTSYKSGYPDAYVITLPSSRAKVAFFPGINSGPAFSPDGSRLALTLSKEGNPLIYTLPSGGGAPTRVTPGGEPHAETSPCWSPDGTKIVYDSDARGSAQLYTVPAGGGTPSRLPTVSGYSAEPDWSPDGSKIAFTGRSGGQFQIGVYDLRTGQSSLLTTDGGEDPSWTRNSRHLVYARGGGLWVLDTVTHATARLETGLTQATEPAVSR